MVVMTSTYQSYSYSYSSVSYGNEGNGDLFWVQVLVLILGLSWIWGSMSKEGVEMVQGTEEKEDVDVNVDQVLLDLWDQRLDQTSTNSTRSTFQNKTKDRSNDNDDSDGGYTDTGSKEKQ